MNQILLSLGLDVRGFHGNLKAATDGAKSFQREWRDLGLLFRAGGLTYLVTGFFRSVIDHAREAKGELDSNTRATITLGNAWDYASNKVSGWGVQTVGWLTKAALAWAAMNGLTTVAAKGFADMVGNTDELKKAQEELAKVTHDRAVAEAADSEKQKILYADLVKLLNERREITGDEVALTKKNIEIQQKMGEITRVDVALEKAKTEAIKRGFDEDMKWVKEQDAAAARHKQFLFEQKSLEDQIVELQARAVALRKEAVYDSVKQVELDGVLKDLGDKRAEQAERTAVAAAKARTEAEGQAEALRMTQKAYESIMFGITNGGASSGQIQDSTDEALKELMRRNNFQAQLIGTKAGVNPGGGADITEGLNLLRLQNENARIKRELATRSEIRRDVNFFGVEGARRQFEGDPLIFDRLVAEFTQTRTETGKLLASVDKLITRIGPDTPGNLPSTVASLSDTMRRGLDALGQRLNDLRRN